MTGNFDDIPYPPDYGAPHGEKAMTINAEVIKRHIAEFECKRNTAKSAIERAPLNGAIAALEALLAEANTPSFKSGGVVTPRGDLRDPRR